MSRRDKPLAQTANRGDPWVLDAVGPPVDAADRRAHDRASTAVDPITGGVLTVDELDGPSRTSLAAVLGLAASLCALVAAATGLLAPVGLAVAALAVVLSVAGLVRTGRPRLTGRGVAVAGMVFGLGAAVVAVGALSGRFVWPNSATDHVADLHAWLTRQWSWLGRWS